MAYLAARFVARQFGALFEGSSVVGLSDRQLLERFNARRDAAGEAAFAALVARHGPMVLGVCRQLLDDRHLAEDAFQAAFLVLARKARSIRDPDLLGNWLYGVALRTSRYARLRLARRRRIEEIASAMRLGSSSNPVEPTVQPADEAVEAREQAEALHAEIERLPAAFRLPVVLCYLEGLTIHEAARRLRWPHGTVRSRIARAREKLRRALSRRGVILPAAAATAVLDSRPASASVSSPLCDMTTRAAIHFAAGQAAGEALSASTTALAQEVLGSMLIHKLMLVAMTVLSLAAVATGAGLLTRSPAMEGEPKKNPAGRSTTAVAAKFDDAVPGRMTVAGRVLDPEGKPIANARVAVLADRKRQVGDIDGRHRNIFMGSAVADADGRFALDVTAKPADRLEHLGLIAAAPGRALAAVDLKTDAARQEASIALPPEKPIEGRLVDVQGQPAAGVVVRVAKLNLGHELRPYDAKGGSSLWPSPASTDANGRFRMLGLGAGAPATYEVEDPRFAHQVFSFHAEGDGGGTLRPGATITLRPSQSVEVRVVHADDGTPAAGTRVDVQALGGENRFPTDDIARARTDGRGRVRVVPWPGIAYRIHVYPPEGEPYLPVLTGIDWPKAAVQQSAEVELRRGAVVRGRLIEDPAGTPVAGARVVYHQTYRDNRRYLDLPSMEAVSGPDGTFTMVVPHGPGHLLVQGPGADYLHIPTSFGEMGVGIRPSFRLYPDAHAGLDIKDGEATHPVELRLRRGVTITGRVVGPDGRPVAEGSAFGRSYTPYREHTFPLVGFNGDPPRIAVKDGRFEIPGCDPEKPGTFYFIDLKDQLGATVNLSGQSAAAGPVTVRLARTATARILVKDADGKPLADREPGDWPFDLRLVITPGPDFDEINNNIDATPGDFAYQVDIDPFRNRGLRSGPDGRATMINLIPGARYRFHGREFTPEPGQAIDLGEVVAKPPG